jgi:hypothetical protein
MALDLITKRFCDKKKLCLRYFKIQKARHRFVVLHKGVKSVIRYEILAKCLQQSIEYDKWYIYVLEKMVLFAVNLPNNKCAE